VVRIFVLWAMLTGCGRIGYEHIALAEDGAVDADVDVDAAPLGAFGIPRVISELSDPSAGDDDPTLTGDRLELYFNSNRTGGVGRADIWVSTRLATTDAWGAPSLVAELSSPEQETAPEVSADGLSIWFGSDRAGGQGAGDIWVSTRSDRSMPWATPIVVSELSSPDNDTASAPGWSGLVMVLESTRAGAASSADLYQATRASTASAWATPSPMVEINTNSHEGSPHLGPEELTLVFNSSRDGNPDLYIATRASIDEPFGTPISLTELNSPENEQDPWISDDLRHMVFVSARSGNTEIYEAVR
jgi:Tol biopolymer transport system component